MSDREPREWTISKTRDVDCLHERRQEIRGPLTAPVRVVALDPDRLIPIIEQAIQREACVVPFGDYRRAAVAVFDALNGGGEDVS